MPKSSKGFKVVNGAWYDRESLDSLIYVLEQLRAMGMCSRSRVRIYYELPQNAVVTPWKGGRVPEYDMGYVRVAPMPLPLPIILYNQRAHSGFPIMDRYVSKITRCTDEIEMPIWERNAWEIKYRVA